VCIEFSVHCSYGASETFGRVAHVVDPAFMCNSCSTISFSSGQYLSSTILTRRRNTSVKAKHKLADANEHGYAICVTHTHDDDDVVILKRCKGRVWKKTWFG
jgi:hypothetical protein